MITTPYRMCAWRQYDRNEATTQFAFRTAAPDSAGRPRLIAAFPIRLDHGIVWCIEGGGPVPRQGTPDRRRLSSWLSPFGAKTNHEVRQRIAECRPALMPWGVSYQERETSRQRRLDEVVDVVVEHGCVPEGSSPALEFAKDILRRKIAGSDAITDRIANSIPSWTAYNALLDYCRQGGPRRTELIAQAVSLDAHIPTILEEHILLGKRLPVRSGEQQQRQAIDYVQAYAEKWGKYPVIVEKVANYR